MPEFDNNMAPSARNSNNNNTIAVMQREATREEKLTLQETIEENKRSGFFRRIFPSIDYLYYKQFFLEDRPLNRFLDDRIMTKRRDNAP